jgi:uncharacterized protein
MAFFKKSKRPPFRLFFATDVHGSDRCFRKFLAAAGVYDADVLLLGGDVAGKAMVPLCRTPDGGYRFSFHGEAHAIPAQDLEQARATINFSGFYPYVCDSEELTRMSDEPGYVEQLFEDAIVEQLVGWCRLAAERLPDQVRCIITPGNDDPLAIDRVLDAAEKVECPEREMIEVGPMWLGSLGNTNRTPWDTDREFDEPELLEQIRQMVGPYADGRPMVFNFHCPPFDSGLDTATKLDADLRPVIEGGAMVEVPVGSTAVRDAIVEFRPVAGIHGHIHESHGARKIGSTHCFNPGSEYSSGILKGLILDLEDDGRYRNHLLTTG